ncbi:MAG: lipocalin family protein [Acidimicrobiia bacterium]
MKRFASVLVLALVVSACSSGTTSDTTTTTTTVAASADGASATTTTGAAPETTTSSTAAATTTTAAQSDTGSLAACVVGTWVLDPVAFFDEVLALQPQDGLDGEFVFVSGDYVLVIGADGSFESRRDDWTFAVMSDAGDLQITVRDTDSGTWTIDGDVLSTAVTPGDPPEIEILIDGQPFEFPTGIPFEPPEAEFTGATVACDGDQLSATSEGYTSIWMRTA